MRETFCILLLSVAFLCAQTPLQAQKSRTVLDGVYSDAQAARGAAIFGAKCAGCHEGADVDGPPLELDPFIDRWREDSLQPLFTFLKTKMPQDAPGSLTEANYLDLLSAILQKNMFPAGSQELSTGALAGTLLVGREGPKPLPTNAMVLGVGCFTAGANDTFTLANASSLARTQSGDETNPEEIKSSAARPLGSLTFRLQNLAELPGFNADNVKSKKVQAKGVLVRQAAGGDRNNADRINVLSLEVLASACAQ
jgi:hypothetical protein